MIARSMHKEWRRAALEGDLAVIDGLLHEGIDIDSKDRYGQTALMLAARHGHEQVVQLLLGKEADGGPKHLKAGTKVTKAYQDLSAVIDSTGLCIFFAVRNLAAACERHGATLVHYSTDYVFNGRAKEPYGAEQPRDPVNAYGRSKALGERLLEESGVEHLLDQQAGRLSAGEARLVQLTRALIGAPVALLTCDLAPLLRNLLLACGLPAPQRACSAAGEARATLPAHANAHGFPAPPVARPSWP